MPISLNIEEKTQRPLSKKEGLALQTYFRGMDTADLFVAESDSNVHGELIVRKVAAAEQTPSLTEQEAPEHAIICSLLWLARMDAGKENFLADEIEREQLELPENVIVFEDNLAADHLGYLRDEKTSLRNFRFHSDELCGALFKEAVADLSVEDNQISNPLIRDMGAETMAVPKLTGKVVMVPILRAGMALVKPAMEVLPKTKQGFMGLSRDEETLEADMYLSKLPEMEEDFVVIIADPMLATGGTISTVIDEIRKGPVQPKEIRIVCVVASPEGIAAINEKCGTDVKIYTAAVDSHLNDVGYIVPGLGDYGDRYTGVA